MSRPRSLSLQKVLGGLVGLPFSALAYTVSNPVLTGALLYVLTRGPPHIREKLLAPLQSTLLATNPDGRLAKVVTALKYLLALGVLRKANDGLNALAADYWHFTRQGAEWKWDGKTELVLITGGCSGFGYEMTRSFAGKARVVLLDISPFPPELEKLPGVHYYKCDITDFPALTELTDQIKKEHGNPSVLINNAGIGNGKSVLDTTTEQFDRLFKVNLTSHFVLIKEFLPGMLQARKGHIVGIASMASFLAAPGLLDYCCSKVGVLYLNDGIRAELLSRYENGHCIRTTIVHPSWHSTALVKPAEKILNKYGIYPDPASNVSDLVVEQVFKGKSGQIFVPKNQRRLAGIRNLPVWVQDVLGGFAIARRGNRFRFGVEEGSDLLKR